MQVVIGRKHNISVKLMVAKSRDKLHNKQRNISTTKMQISVILSQQRTKLSMFRKELQISVGSESCSFPSISSKQFLSVIDIRSIVIEELFTMMRKTNKPDEDIRKDRWLDYSFSSMLKQKREKELMPEDGG